MRTLAVYLMAFACSFSLVLPSGWCCLLNSGCCSTAGETGTTATPEEKPLPCCRGAKAHQQDQQGTNPNPALKAPPQRSQTPPPECRCQERLATAAKEKHSGVELGISSTSLAQVFAPAPVASHDPVFPTIFASPPFYILECVWLC